MQSKLYNLLLLLFTFLFILPKAFANNKYVDEQISQCQYIVDNADGKPDGFKKLVAISTATISNSKSLSQFQLSKLNYFAGVGYYNLKQLDSARHYFEECHKTSIAAKEIYTGAYALGSLVNIYSYLGTNEKSDSAARLLQPILDTTKNNKLKAICYYALGNYHIKSRSFLNLGLTELLQGMTAIKPIIDTTVQTKNKVYYAALGIAIADVYYSLNQYPKALQYLYEVKEDAKISVPSFISILGRFIKNYAAIGQIDSALLYSNQLSVETEKYPSNWSEPITGNLALFRYFIKNDNVKKAKEFLDTAIVQSANSKVGIMISQTDAGLGEYYMTVKDYNNAKIYFNKAVDPMFAIDKKTYCDIRMKLTEIAILQGDVQNANNELKLYTQTNDSLVNEKISGNIAEMEAIYQNGIKKQEIAVQHAKIAFAKKRQILLIAIIAALCMLALVIFSFYKSKQRNATRLSKLNEALEEANKTKAKLFGIISHDLRSPINQVYQFLKLQQLNPDALSQDQKSTLSEKIQTATGSLLETMEDLLIWSKSQMDSFKIDVQPTTIAPIVDTCQKLLQLNSEAKNITYQNVLPESIVVNTDSYYLQTIIRNLLQNAIKASPQNGYIKINAVAQLQEVVVSIQNQGGAYTHKEYDAFIANEENAKSLTGLGLRLVHELSQKIGATVVFENPADDVTKVNIILPIQ